MYQMEEQKKLYYKLKLIFKIMEYFILIAMDQNNKKDR